MDYFKLTPNACIWSSDDDPGHLFNLLFLSPPNPAKTLTWPMSNGTWECIPEQCPRFLWLPIRFEDTCSSHLLNVLTLMLRWSPALGESSQVKSFILTGKQVLITLLSSWTHPAFLSAVLSMAPPGALNDTPFRLPPHFSFLLHTFSEPYKSIICTQILVLMSASKKTHTRQYFCYCVHRWLRFRRRTQRQRKVKWLARCHAAGKR